MTYNDWMILMILLGIWCFVSGALFNYLWEQDSPAGLIVLFTWLPITIVVFAILGDVLAAG